MQPGDVGQQAAQPPERLGQRLVGVAVAPGTAAERDDADRVQPEAAQVALLADGLAGGLAHRDRDRAEQQAEHRREADVADQVAGHLGGDRVLRDRDRAGWARRLAAVLGGSSCLARPTSDAVAVVTIDLLRSAEASVAETTSRSVPSCTCADRLAWTWAVVSGRSSSAITLSATRGPVSSTMYELSRLALASGSPVPVVTNSTIDER